MKKYEYQTTELRTAAVVETEQKHLNEQGDDGWELAAVLFLTTVDTTIYYWKREIV